MKKITKLLALGLCLVLLLSGCSLFEEEETSVLPYTFVHDAENNSGLRSGSVIYTVTGFRTIDNINDLPEEGGIRDYSYSPNKMIYLRIWNNDSEKPVQTSIGYPDFVNEDGSFDYGTYMVLVEYTVTSDGAEQKTVEDLNDYGKPWTDREDTYLFGCVPAGFTLTYKKNREKSATTLLAYFSGLDPEFNYYSFRLLPGETKSFVVGFFVNQNRTTGRVYEPSELYLQVPLYYRDYPSYDYVPIGENLTEE